MVSNIVLLNKSLVMTYSINIVDYSLLFLGNVDVDILVFLENSIGIEGVDMVSPLVVSLYLAHPYHRVFFRYNGIFYSLCLAFDYSIL